MRTSKTLLFKRLPRCNYLYNKSEPYEHNHYAWFQRLITALLFAIVVTFIASLNHHALAQTDISLSQVSLNKVSEGSLLIKTDTAGQYHQIPLLLTNVDMSISGMIVRSKLKQTFKNISNDWVEAIYVFPLPETAAVDQLRMTIGERKIIGEIKEKTIAKKIYETAKKKGFKSALIEQERPNLFTTSVSNIAPGETIIIEIEYQQTINYQQGKFNIRFPMTITPRYIPGRPIRENISFSNSGWSNNTDQVADANRITPPIITETQNKISNKTTLNIDLNAGFPIDKIISRYHKIITTEKNNIMYISLASVSTIANRDFELEWTPQPNSAPKAAIFSEQVNESYYQLLMLVPPEITQNNGPVLAKKVTYVIDTSGSMYGASMDQAKSALIMALDKLSASDKFNIIQFDSDTSQLFSRAHIASTENINTAKDYVHSLKADGGTEIAPALKLALGQPTDDHFLHQIIFLTDGSIGNESDLLTLIRERLGDSRLFTVAIGSAPNSFFMRKAAQLGRGSFTYIGGIDEVNSKMTMLFNQIENPLMRNIRIKLNTDINAEILPGRIPDLYFGQTLIVAIKSDKPLEKITVDGIRAQSPWSSTLTLNNSSPGKGIGTFWARKKIAALSDTLHEGAKEEQVRTNIIDVALAHHLVSKHTSLVAVDKTPSRPVSHALEKRAIPLNPPHSQSFGTLAQTATTSQLQLISGLVLLILSFALKLFFTRQTKQNF